MRRGGNHQQRERDSEGRTTGLHIADADFAAMLLHDAVADAETEACSLSDGFGGVKRIEDAVRVCNAGTIILELDAQAIPRNLSPNDDFPRAARFFNGVDRVIENIQKHLLELMEIAADGRQMGVEFPPDNDFIVAHGEFPKNESLFEYLIHLDGSALGLLLTGKTEQILDDVVGSLSLFIELINVVQPSRENELFRFQQLGVAEYGG